MKTWKIHKNISSAAPDKRRQEITDTLLNIRGLNSKNDITNFFSPPHPRDLKPKQLGIDPAQLNTAITRIKQAIKSQTPIIVYGDYDADGICATAILWETLHQLGANTTPFIPHRKKHGYGISQKGIDQLIADNLIPKTSPKPLIITVDNGIVAHEAVNYANKKGIDVIVSDHHVASKTLPKATAIVHTTTLAGAGVSWVLAQSIASSLKKNVPQTLELAAIGTVADMVPLLSFNRAIVKHGFALLKNTNRIGLQELVKQAAIDSGTIGTYEINFIIAPRINAMGRLGHALDSLRLLCTTSRSRAADLAVKLGSTNDDRKQLTQDQLIHARAKAKPIVKSHNIIIVGHHSYHEGVIGLIAGKLVEYYWRPSIVVSRGKTTSKASARSIPGFNIIEALRQAKDLLLDVGGHPMAAGFTVDNKNLDTLTQKLQSIAQKKLNPELLKRQLSIDCEIMLPDITWKLHRDLDKFEPFGIANPRPIFSTKKAEVLQARAVGRDLSHLKLSLKHSPQPIPAIGFRLGEHAANLNTGDKIDLAYTIDENHWQGKTDLQLKIKDIVSPYQTRNSKA